MIAALLLAAAAPPLPAFSFREHNTEGTYNLDALRSTKGCEADGPDILCAAADNVVGRFAVIQYRIANRHLSMLRIVGDRSSIPDVLAAFTERYGRPCETGTEEVQNRLGARFTSQTATWCFRTGKLVLHERGQRIDMYAAVYTDEVNVPSARQVRPDF